MTYFTCKKVIENRKNVLSEADWAAFAEETAKKLDVFLLNNRISEEQYQELTGMLK